MKNKKYEIDVLKDERAEELKDLWRWQNDDGARWYDVNEMLDYLDTDELCRELDVPIEALDAVVLGESPDLDTAIKALSAKGDV
jgi:hypothetical protein